MQWKQSNNKYICEVWMRGYHVQYTIVESNLKTKKYYTLKLWYPEAAYHTFNTLTEAYDAAQNHLDDMREILDLLNK